MTNAMTDKINALGTEISELGKKYSSYKARQAQESHEFREYTSSFSSELSEIYHTTKKVLGKRNFVAGMRGEDDPPKGGKKITKKMWHEVVGLCETINNMRLHYRFTTDRSQRKAISMPTPAELLQRKIEKDRIDMVCDIKRSLDYHPSFGDLSIAFDNSMVAPSINCSTENLGKYSRSCRYLKVARHCDITMSRKWKVNNTDGVTMLVKHSKNLENCTISHGWALSRKGNSYEVSCTEMYCITDSRTGLSAHATTIKKAKKDLDKKIKILMRDQRNCTLKLDDEINIAKYREITGACQAGCEQFCKREGLDLNGSICVRDLLTKLRTSDFGASTFRKNVAMFI